MAALNQKQEQDKRERISAEQWMSSQSLPAQNSNAVYDMGDDQRALAEVWDDEKGCVIHLNSYSLSQPARNVPLDSAGNRPSAESWAEESRKELTSGNNSAVKQQSFLNFGQKPQQQDKMPQALKRSGNMQKFLAQVCRRLLHLHFRSSSPLFPH
jgi:hypothetical protein